MHPDNLLKIRVRQHKAISKGIQATEKGRKLKLRTKIKKALFVYLAFLKTSGCVQSNITTLITDKMAQSASKLVKLAIDRAGNSLSNVTRLFHIHIIKIICLRSTNSYKTELHVFIFFIFILKDECARTFESSIRST